MQPAPRFPGVYMVGSILFAVATFLGVQFVYNWELQRVGLLVAAFSPGDIVLQTFTVHGASFLMWLALALLAAVVANRGQAAAALAAAEAFERQRQAMEDLKVQNKAKSDFVSIMSHEFRTPLTGIQGFSEMIRDEDLTLEEVKEFAGEINRAAQRLNAMIGDVLDLDRMESGRTKLQVKPVDLNAILTEVVERVRPNAPNHQVTLQLDGSMPQLTADSERVGQVLSNLLDNAIKYSPKGGEIVVSSRLEPGAAHVLVQDHGAGIAPEVLGRIFERHTRRESFIQGIGLGLPIVRQIVEMHGGKVWAESAVGEGSVFHLTIPLA